ncbi:DNA polymerase I [Desulfurobacterium thermolithotrophum]|uniref:DNA polymerase I n=1 Tax=Desulfurobacterium thermolithotrophum TaxID=64160 RepID=UPI0013D74E33|nr:DNA polymerase I [Desulfurobacterium thermolithotrophum]
MSKKTIYLFDGTSLAYRAYYAIKDLSTSKGFPTNAIYGFIRMFLKLYKDFKPNYIAVAFDVGKKTFRSKLLKEYKANRKPTPDSFKLQLPYIKKFLECLGITILEKEGFEADDILGTAAKKFASEGYRVFVVTPDKDMRQLIDEKISVIAINKTGQKEIYDLESFKKKYGIEPEQIPDFFGLVGDSVDNIPGVPSVGEKTAQKLIAEFGNLENLYKNLSKLTSKRREVLEKFKEQAFLSRELAKIKKNVPIEISLENLKVKEPQGKCLGEFLKELEMRSIVSELKKLFPSIDFGEFDKFKKSKKLSKEEFKRKIQPADLFSTPEVAVIHDFERVIAINEGYVEVDFKEIEEFLPERGKIYTFDLKSLYHKVGEKLRNFSFIDLSVCEYLLNPLQKNYSSKDILKKRLGVVSLEEVKDYVHYTLDIGKEILNELKKEGLENLYESIEHPLTFVLYKMEKRGVLFDKEYLENFGKELDRKSKEIEKKIFEIAGEEFNLNSPKQLSRVLFEKLKLKPLKKTKSGYSTDVETLTALALKGHKIAEFLLEYRKLTKLNSTFVKGILKHMDEDGRVRTTFIQTGTATGRLSSAEPNLQNLPVSDEISKKIRYAVTAPSGYNLIWADYSQIELRILAHLSQDEKLLEAYRKGRDIHTETASYLFGVSAEEVDEKLRRIAKTVNFGIIYGMSPHGLSERLGISVEEAEKYIERYFEKFPKVKEYIENTLREAYEKGYVKTVFGRKRPLPELKSSNKNIKSFGERAAVNATIQGTAADIMKLAMVKLYEKLKDAYMVLQVHDEIVIEALEEKTEEIKKTIKETMENVVKLSVPLTVDVKVGKHWS